MMNPAHNGTMTRELVVTRSLPVSPHEEHCQNVVFCLLGHGISSEHVDGLADELLRPENAVVFESLAPALAAIARSVHILSDANAEVDAGRIVRGIVEDVLAGRL